MDPSGLARLTERQRQCLRLYHANLEVKEIAGRLGLSPHTVNEHLREARKLLGTDRSIQAARLLAAAEGDKRIVPEPFGVAAAPPPDDGRPAPSSTVPETRTPENRYDLSTLERIGLIVGIAIGIVLLAGATIIGAYAITRVLQDRGIDISDKPYRP